MTKRPLAPDAVDAFITADGIRKNTLSDQLEITMLGAGQEVGRSCCLLKFKGRTIVCDTGLHPGLPGLSALPFIDEVEWNQVDCVLITHFHIDHAASLPYVMEKTNFKEGNGKVYMTKATKAVYNFLMRDFVKISFSGGANDDGDDAPREQLYDESELRRSFDLIEGVNYLEQVIVPSSDTNLPTITFTSYYAGHVLGAAMFLIEIGGARILYTGDYSTEDDRHLVPASVPNWGRSPDIMICESTYGVQNHQARLEKEEMFTTQVAQILKRGGRVLMPVFAVGRAQELLLILEDYWLTHPELSSFPIFYIGGLASKCMSVYRQHSSSLNSNIQARVARGDNPFDFRKAGVIRELKGANKRDRFDDTKPCVVMASPGMLQDGVSRELLEKWAPDARNGLMLTGYSVEGTLAREMQNEPREIEAIGSKKKIPRKMSVHYISFSAHVDFQQNSTFIDTVKPAHLVLVHGSRDNMFRLRDALKHKYKDKQEDVQIYTPSNVRDKLQIKMSGNRIAKAVGTLAESAPQEGETVTGLLIGKDGSYTLLASSDLHEFTGLTTTTISQRQHLNIEVGWELVLWHLQKMYGKIQIGLDENGLPTARIMQAVDLKMAEERKAVLEWPSGATNDMVADSVIALLVGIDSSPASVKATSRAHSHSHKHV